MLSALPQRGHCPSKDQHGIFKDLGRMGGSDLRGLRNGLGGHGLFRPGDLLPRGRGSTPVVAQAPMGGGAQVRGWSAKKHSLCHVSRYWGESGEFGSACRKDDGHEGTGLALREDGGDFG